MTFIATARDIMGKNFLGLEEVCNGYAVLYSDDQLLQILEIAYSEERLQACKDTHILFPGYPLSLIDIHRKCGDLFYDNDWYHLEAFANEKKVSVRWYLIRKEPVPGSLGKTYSEQTDLLPKEEEVPFACEVLLPRWQEPTLSPP
jgi:hypothetical protein